MREAVCASENRRLPVRAEDLLEGLDGLLLSTGKSLFLYSPPLILALFGLRDWWRTRRPDALLIGSGPYFYARRVQLALLSARYGIPTMYTQRQYVEAGGLLSYGANVSGAWREVGLYIGRILKGAKPADLPVVQASKFELVINADTARTLDISVPPSLLSVADEVIE